MRLRMNKWFRLSLLIPLIFSSIVACQGPSHADCLVRSVQPSTIYASAWRLVRNNYVDANFNGQDWSQWEHKYDGQLHSTADAKEAIKTMLASLNDPYTRIAARSAVEETASNTATEQSVTCKILKENVGYIKISSFDSVDCPSEFYSALKQLANANFLILDLRGNRGGLVTNALKIADMLLEEGSVVSTISREGKQSYTASGVALTQQSITVFADQNSASASEILIGALHDNHRATIMGARTFGKGLIQEVDQLPAGMTLYITVSRYLTPAGTDINKVGIKPDIEIEAKNES